MELRFVKDFDTKLRHSREGGNPSPAGEVYGAGDGPPPSRGLRGCYLSSTKSHAVNNANLAA